MLSGKSFNLSNCIYNLSFLSLLCHQSFSKELLTAWIKYLETTNPHLQQVPVIFNLNSAPPSDLVVVQSDTDATDSVAVKH